MKTMTSNMLIFFLSLSASLSAHSQILSQINGKEYGLSRFGNRVPLKACYRWMTTSEMKKWKKGKPFMAKYPQDIALLRASDLADKVIFCWSNPVTGKIGGLGEDYGDHLVRIDLDPNALIFDRNQNKYFRGQLEITENDPEKKGVGTPLVYGRYTVNGVEHFQEYMIRSDSVIVGWSFKDQALQNEFTFQLARLQSKFIPMDEFHHFHNAAENKKMLFFEEQGYPYYLSRVQEAYSNTIQSDWNDSSFSEYFIGLAGPRVCPTQPNCLVSTP